MPFQIKQETHEVGTGAARKGSDQDDISVSSSAAIGSGTDLADKSSNDWMPLFTKIQQDYIDIIDNNSLGSDQLQFNSDNLLKSESRNNKTSGYYVSFYS